MRRRQRRQIRRSQLDYLLLEVFGPRYLPEEVAARIALRAELARGITEAFHRHPDLGSPQPTSMEAVAV